MAMLAIIMAIGVPYMANWQINAKVRAAAEGMQTALRMAQAEAIRRNRTVEVILHASSDPRAAAPTASSSGRQWQVRQVIPSGFEIIDARAGTESGGTQVTVGSNDAVIGFDAFGRLAAGSDASLPTGGRVQIDYGYQGMSSTAYRPLRLVVAPAGQVRMCVPSVTDAASPTFCN